MVQISAIREQNTSFAAQKHANNVCVFIGATNGIGQSTLRVVSTLLVTPTIYVVGRSASRWKTQLEDLSKLESHAKFVFVEADVSTIRGVDEACNQIMAASSRIDYLFMSAGYFPLIGQVETSEGLEQCFALSYWARIRFIHNLLLPLQQSPRPRILSIFAGGHETQQLREDDMDLSKSWSIPNFAYQVSIMMTLVFHHFAKQNPKFTLIHTWPGYVLTGTERKPKPDTSASFWWRWTHAFLQQLAWIFMSFQAIPEEQSGQRHAFLLTNDKYGPGVCRFNEYCEASPRSEQLEKSVQEGKPEKVWDCTVATWDRALGKPQTAAT